MQETVPSAAAGVEGGSRLTAWQLRRYLMLIVGSLALEIALLLTPYFVMPDDRGVAHDFFGQVTKAGDANWYRDVGGRQNPQIQDQDIFYSNIGHSIAAARASDIVFLGPSFVSRGIDRQTLQASPQLDRLKIYNMSFVGIRGGEFSRRIIQRWHIRPRLWVINADDQFVHFFSDDLNLTIRDEKTPIVAAERSRFRAYLTVLGRNIRWRIEDWKIGRPGGEYRNVATGDLLNTHRAYDAPDNKRMRVLRGPDCSTNAAVIDYARRMVDEIGGQVVLMLVPPSQICARQAAELAAALGVEFIPPPDDDELTTSDNGGHLDRRGAARFTHYLAGELVKTRAFKTAFGQN